MFDFQEWWCQIDWSATGSMLAGIGTCVAAGFAVFIAIKQNNLTREIAVKQNDLTKQIAEKQIKQTELAQKIALYDKRYEIYLLFTQYLSYGGMLAHTIKDLDTKNNLMLIESIYYTNSSDRELLTNKLANLAGNIKDPQKVAMKWMQEAAGLHSAIADEYIKDSNDFNKIYKNLENLDYEFSEKQIQKAKMSEFCFPEEISKYVIQYISLLFSWTAYEKKCLDAASITECYKKICEAKIVNKMKVFLKISYDEVSMEN